jgi:hypothetical protein
MMGLRRLASIIALTLVALVIVLAPAAARSKTLTGCGGYDFVDTLQTIRGEVGADYRTVFLLGKEWRILYKYDEDERLISCEYSLADEAFGQANAQSCQEYAREVESELEKQRKIVLLGFQETAGDWQETYRYPDSSEITVMFDWQDGQDQCVGRIEYIKQRTKERGGDAVTF